LDIFLFNTPSLSLLYFCFFMVTPPCGIAVIWFFNFVTNLLCSGYCHLVFVVGRTFTISVSIGFIDLLLPGAFIKENIIDFLLLLVNDLRNLFFINDEKLWPRFIHLSVGFFWGYFLPLSKSNNRPVRFFFENFLFFLKKVKK